MNENFINLPNNVKTLVSLLKISVSYFMIAILTVKKEYKQKDQETLDSTPER